MSNSDSNDDSPDSREIADHLESLKADPVSLQHEADRLLKDMTDQRDAVLALAKDHPEMADAVVRMDREIKALRQSLHLSSFGMLNVAEWKPGERIEIARQTMTGTALARTAMATGFPTAVLWAFFAPFVVPFAGFIVGLPMHLVPGTREFRVRVYLTIVDLFALGWPVLPWAVFLFCLAIVRLAVHLDAAFSPRRVILDWQLRLLIIRTRHDEQTHLLSEIERLTVHLVTTTDPKDEVPQARLIAHLSETHDKSAVLLETDSDEVTKGYEELDKSPMDRMSPIAEQLAAVLRVPCGQGEPMTDDFDCVGFPRRKSIRHERTIWGNAGGRSRFAVVLLCTMILAFLIIRGAACYSKNQNVRLSHDNAATVFSVTHRVFNRTVPRRITVSSNAGKLKVPT